MKVLQNSREQDFQEKLSKFLATNKLFLVFKTNLNLIIFWPYYSSPPSHSKSSPPPIHPICIFFSQKTKPQYNSNIHPNSNNNNKKVKHYWKRKKSKTSNKKKLLQQNCYQIKVHKKLWSPLYVDQLLLNMRLELEWLIYPLSPLWRKLILFS